MDTFAEDAIIYTLKPRDGKGRRVRGCEGPPRWVRHVKMPGGGGAGEPSAARSEMVVGPGRLG